MEDMAMEEDENPFEQGRNSIEGKRPLDLEDLTEPPPGGLVPSYSTHSQLVNAKGTP